MMDWMGNGWGYGMGFGWLFPLALLGLAVWAIVSLSRRALPGANRPDAYSEDALSVLGKRYARGELDRESYLQMRRDLEG